MVVEPAPLTKRQNNRAEQADTQSHAQQSETVRAAAAEAHVAYYRETRRAYSETYWSSKESTVPRAQGRPKQQHLHERGPDGEQPPAISASAFMEGTEKRGADGTSLWAVESFPNLDRSQLASKWVLVPPKATRRDRSRDRDRD